MDIERRFFEIVDGDTDEPTVEVRDEGSPKIRGLAAAYQKWSLDLGGFREIIEPGAFDRVLSKRKLDVVALFDHEGQPLGRTASGTLRLSTDERGLNYEIDPPDTQLGRDLQTLIRRRDLFGSSFAFTVDPKGEAWSQDEKGNATRTIREFSGLYDVSIVTHAAYGPATSVAVRSLERWRSENLTAQEQREMLEQDTAVKYSASVGARAAVAAAIARLRNYAR
jgi:HK97 family phage prohead protease